MNALCAVVGYALGLRTFASCNLILTAINFLPAVPLDGGLILRSVLERVLGDEARAMRAAVVTSMAVMLGMAIVGVVLLQPLLVYLAVVITYDNWRKHL